MSAVKTPTYWTGPETSPFWALPVDSFLIAPKSTPVSSFTHTHIHTRVPLNSDELLEPQQLVGAEPQGHVWTQLTADSGINAIYTYTGRCQNSRRQLAAIQAVEGDSPGARSSPNEIRQCSVAFGATCDLALGANLVPPLPGPCQLDALPSGPHSRGEAH